MHSRPGGTDRKPYRAPALRYHGTIAELTQTDPYATGVPGNDNITGYVANSGPTS